MAVQKYFTADGTTAKITKSRRYWRRSRKPALWWPWGLLPVFGLAVLFLFGAMITAPNIQAEVRNEVADRFDGAGVMVDSLSADGRRISARVTGATLSDEFVTALAQSTKCDTWAGKLNCPTVVRIERNVADAAPAITRARPHQFEVIRSDDRVTLSGEVPTLTERNRILGVAGEYFGQVDDQLTITQEVATDDFSTAADRALAVVNHLVAGQASWSGESLSVTGVANRTELATAREQFGNADASGMPGSFDVTALTEPGAATASCNQAFSDLFVESTIRFQTGSATIDAGNNEILERLADIARGCPGNLTIEGHTDDIGDAEMNRTLSLARAAAVRDALAAQGVAADRMTAVGRGESDPVADNRSPEGRAINRRIVIKVE